MADYTWPFSDTDRNFCTEAFDEALEFNVELSVARSGKVTTLALPGARWRTVMQFPDTTVAYLRQRRQLYAFLASLRGGADRLLLWSLHTPEPLGTMRGALTLTSALSPGATSAQFAGPVSARPNMLPGGSFETGPVLDGMADGWLVTVGGSGDAGRVHAISRAPSVTPAHGSFSQFVQITALGNSLDTAILSSRVVLSPGAVYTLSGAVRASVSGKVFLLARTYDSGGSSVGDFSTATIAATGARVAASVTFTAPATATQCDVFVRGINEVGEFFDADALQLQAGGTVTAYSGLPTLLRGDFIGIGSQRVMLTADLVTNEGGAGTVQFQPAHRTGAANGAAVTLVRPTTKYVLTSPVVQMPARGGALPGFAVELVEE